MAFKLFYTNPYSAYIDILVKLLESQGCQNIYDGEVRPIPSIEDFLGLILNGGQTSISVDDDRHEGWWISLNRFTIPDFSNASVKTTTQDERLATVTITGWINTNNFRFSLAYARDKVEKLTAYLSYGLGFFHLPNVQIQEIEGRWGRRNPPGSSSRDIYIMNVVIEFVIRDKIIYNYPKNLTVPEQTQLDKDLNRSEEDLPSYQLETGLQ